MSGLKLDIAHSALLVMDFQTPVVERYAVGQDNLLAATARAIAAARQSGMRVIYVVVAFRAGFPEISPYNKIFSALKTSGGIAADIHPRVAPATDEVIVTKCRVSAFMGTDLDIILRSNAIHTLVMCGVATSGVVLSTLRHAADSDYRILVLRDCCSDMDQSVHALLLEKLFPTQAAIVSSVELIHVLKGRHD
jgi:nicotinamidase-related amidase